MFVFEDVKMVDDKGIQAVLRRSTTTSWPRAQDGVGRAQGADLHQHVRARGRQLIKEDMEYMGPVRVSDVESAQQRIVDVVRRLEEAGDVVRLALEIAQRIVRNAAYRTDDAVVDQVGKAVEQLIAPTSLTVRINPRDASVLSEAMPALARRFGMSGHAEIIEDEMVDVGGCVVNCGRGAIDATIERQLERIVEALSPAPPEAGHEEETDVS
jgi:flagellar biosynthesis/type III secretory pathway protein FliH